MEAVEALYKTHPEYLDYMGLIYALNDNNPKLLYKGFPEARESKIFDSFTKASLIDIRRNLLTTKYPILFVSYYTYLCYTSKSPFSKKEIKDFHKKLDAISIMNLSEQENKIINRLGSRADLWMKIKAIEPFVDQKYIKIPIN